MYSLIDTRSDSGTDLLGKDGSSIRVYGGGGRRVYGRIQAKGCLLFCGLFEGKGVTRDVELMGLLELLVLSCVLGDRIIVLFDCLV